MLYFTLISKVNIAGHKWHCNNTIDGANAVKLKEIYQCSKAFYDITNNIVLESNKHLNNTRLLFDANANLMEISVYLNASYRNEHSKKQKLAINS